MNWVELWAKIHVIEKFIGLTIVSLIIIVFVGGWLLIYIGDKLDDRKRKRRRND